MKASEPVIAADDIGVPLAVLAVLVNRRLFPEPVHMNPPIWRAKDVETWTRRASVR